MQDASADIAVVSGDSAIEDDPRDERSRPVTWRDELQRVREGQSTNRAEFLAPLRTIIIVQSIICLLYSLALLSGTACFHLPLPACHLSTNMPQTATTTFSYLSPHLVRLANI